jgi:hypothetical protein
MEISRVASPVASMFDATASTRTDASTADADNHDLQLAQLISEAAAANGYTWAENAMVQMPGSVGIPSEMLQFKRPEIMPAPWYHFDAAPLELRQSYMTQWAFVVLNAPDDRFAHDSDYWYMVDLRKRTAEVIAMKKKAFKLLKEDALYVLKCWGYRLPPHGKKRPPPEPTPRPTRAPKRRKGIEGEVLTGYGGVDLTNAAAVKTRAELLVKQEAEEETARRLERQRQGHEWHETLTAHEAYTPEQRRLDPIETVLKRLAAAADIEDIEKKRYTLCIQGGTGLGKTESMREDLMH